MTYDVLVTERGSRRVVETIAAGESEADALRIARSVRVNLDHASYRVDVVETKGPSHA